MARQENPFALLGDDEEGADVSVLLAKLEAMTPTLPPPASEQTKPSKQKAVSNGFPSKFPAMIDLGKGERGRGRGDRGRGSGRGGFGNVVVGDAVNHAEHLHDSGYDGESSGERSRGRGGRAGFGRGSGRGGFGNVVVGDAVNHAEHLHDSGYDGESSGERSRGRGGRAGFGRGSGRGGFGNVGGSDAIDQAEHFHDSRYNGESGGERSRGCGGRAGFSRGSGRAGFGNVGGGDAIDQAENFYDSGYNVESGGERSRGLGGRAGFGRGRGRGFGRFGNRNLPDYGNPIDNGEDELQEIGHYVERQPPRYDSRNFEGNQGADREERESHEFRGYGAGRENRGLRRLGVDTGNRDFRDQEPNESSYGGDGESRGFRGGENRGRGYGGRGRRGGRDGGGGGGARNELNEGWYLSATKEVSADEKEPILNNTNDRDASFGWDDPSGPDEPKDVESVKLLPEQTAYEDTSKTPQEDNEMTLAEYEKLLQEKRKAFESFKTQTRKVVLDKDFEGMQIIDRKKEDDSAKMKLDNDKGKKKDISEREDKSRKSLNINEFLKPADVERFRGPTASSRSGRGRRGRGRGGGYTTDHPTSRAAAAAPSLEDPTHFPNLGGQSRQSLIL